MRSCSFSSLFVVVSTAAVAVAVLASRSCQPQSQPNPIVNEYPGQVTGTINGTTAIVPIPYDVARSMIPSEYGILRSAYEALIPGFPKDMYPAEWEGLLDHDVQSLGIRIPDFQRVALRFPFVDRLNDGYSCFRYTAPQLITGTNLIALGGSSMYGKTFPGTFEPSCDAYGSEDGDGSTTYLKAYIALFGTEAKFDTSFTTVDSIPYDQKLFINITNQPSFGSGLSVCDNYITLYNSSVTQGAYTPVPVKGTIKVVPPYYAFEATLEAFGYRMDNAFIEKNNVPCENLKGYAGTGPGDT